MKTAKLGTEEVSRSDRISHQPDDLLLRILSLVPVRIAVSTSVLSRRWKSVWKMMPTLVYDETCPYNGSLGFDKFCGMSLPLHEALKTLTIKLRNQSDSIDTLLFPNIRSPLLGITIKSKSYIGRYSHIRFPNNLNVFKTLLVLKLTGRIVLDFADSSVCFPFLKRLHFRRVELQYKESTFTRLLSACPVLEDLFLKKLVLCLYLSMVLDLTDTLIFNQLRHLELDYSVHSNLLLRLLKHFPNLQSLKLNHRHPIDMNNQQYCLVSELSSVPKCLSFHLEILQWTGYRGTLGEREAAAYFLKNAHRLKTATITLRRMGMVMDNVEIMMKDLRSMSKASASCQLVIG